MGTLEVEDMYDLGSIVLTFICDRKVEMHTNLYFKKLLKFTIWTIKYKLGLVRNYKVLVEYNHVDVTLERKVKQSIQNKSLYQVSCQLKIVNPTFFKNELSGLKSKMTEIYIKFLCFQNLISDFQEACMMILRLFFK